MYVVAQNSICVGCCYKWFAKYEVTDRIVAATGKPVTSEQVYSAINNQWEKGNYSIYADWDYIHTQYVYSLDLAYYNNCVNNIYGV